VARILVLISSRTAPIVSLSTAIENPAQGIDAILTRGDLVAERSSARQHNTEKKCGMFTHPLRSTLGSAIRASDLPPVASGAAILSCD
jgi:hypothetical protein